MKYMVCTDIYKPSSKNISLNSYTDQKLSKGYVSRIISYATTYEFSLGKNFFQCRSELQYYSTLAYILLYNGLKYEYSVEQQCIFCFSTVHAFLITREVSIGHTVVMFMSHTYNLYF